MESNDLKNILVLYHDNCTDGFSAAWAAWSKLGDKAEYIGIKLDMPPDNNFIDKEIYMLDFVYDEEYLPALINKNKKIIAIDHHISNIDSINIIKNHSHDINHSGAILSWKYFRPNKKPPKLLEYVEDSDIGKYSLPFTNELWIYVNMFDFNFKIWSKLVPH